MNTPGRVQRLPPIEDYKMQSLEDRLKKQEETTNALIDRAVKIKEDIVNSQEFMKGNFTDEKRNRELLENHIRTITAVCKKLNFDIEALEAQLTEKTYQINSMDFRLKDAENLNSSSSKDTQLKMSRNESVLGKMENDQNNLANMIKDLQANFHDFSRNINSRMSDTERRISDLNSKFDSVMSDQTMVIRNVEGDTVKQFQLIDSKTRLMIDDIRSQIFTNKASHDTELSKVETRLSEKIFDSLKNNDKYERMDRKLDELVSGQNKKHQMFEEDFQRYTNRFNASIEKLERKIEHANDEKQAKISNDFDKLKKDLQYGFKNVEESIKTLQKVTEGKIKLTEDKLVKDIDKVRKMVIMI